MKKTTRIFALLLALMLTMFCMTACGNESGGAVIDNEKAVNDTVKGFSAALSEADFEAMKSYISADSVELDELDFDALLDEEVENMGDDLEVLGISADEMRELLMDVVEHAFSEASIDIKSTKVNGDKATVEASMTMPEFDSVDSVMTDMDIESSFMTFVEEHAEELENMTTEEEIMEWVGENFATFFKGLVDDVVVPVVTEDTTIELEKIDGKWLITELN